MKKEKPQKIKLPEPNAGIKTLFVTLCILLCPVMLYMFLNTRISAFLSSGGILDYLTDSGYVEADLDEFLYDAFYIDDASEYLSEEDLETCQELYNETMENAVNLFLTGEGELLDVDKCMEFAESHAGLLEEAYGYELEEEDFEYIREDLEYLNEDTAEYIRDEIEYLDEPAATLLKCLDYFTSETYLAIAAAYCLAVLLLMMFFFRKRQDKALIYFSVPAVVSGFLMYMVSGFLKALAVLSESGDWLFDLYLEDSLIPIANTLAGNGIRIAIAVFAAGILLNVIGHVMRRQMKKALAAKQA